MKSAYDIVAEFERRIADFCGSKEAVATMSCTSALFLSCKLLSVKEVTLPARTYISAAFAAMQAGARVRFSDYAWKGLYRFEPYEIYDSALRFKRSMYVRGLVCLSFQSWKHLKIGRGGAILTDDPVAASTLRRMRSNGRDFSIPYFEDRIAEVGWNYHMLPEEAARGLLLLERNFPEDSPDLEFHYPDLRLMPVFQEQVRQAA